MKLVKMSLVAAMLMGASAYAVENVKISGDANVFYSTSDAKGQTSNALVGNDSGTLFDKDSSAADASVNLNVSADLFKNDLVGISAGAGYTAISTLGLENNFVSNVWGGSHIATAGTSANYGNGAAGVDGAKVENASWFNEAYVAVSAGKSAVKIGRMALDTPLAFTETWSIEKNTFESAVLINQDLPGTTIVGAYVGNGNGTEGFGQTDKQSNVQALGLAVGPVVNAEGDFATYGVDGAYAFGIVNNSLEMLTVQAWYYDVTRLAQAYWLQADLSMEGIMAGAQFSAVEVDADSSKEDNIYAVMLGYEMKDLLTIKGSFSGTNSDGSLGAAGFNTATSTGASKIYTEAWWNYSYVTQTDTTAFNIAVESPVQGMFDLGVYYTMADQSEDAGDRDLTELTITAGKSLGPVDATLAYVMTDATDQSLDANGDNETYNIIQAYVTFNF